MNDLNLHFDGRQGRPPERGSLEELVLAACTAEDATLWQTLCGRPVSDIEDAIETLRNLGWGFQWVTLQ